MRDIDDFKNFKDEKENLINDKASFLASIISFFIPNAGIILYFLKRKQSPLLANSFKKGVVLYLIFNFLLIPILFIIVPFIFLYIKK